MQVKTPGTSQRDNDAIFFANTLFSTIGLALGIAAVAVSAPTIGTAAAAAIEALTAFCTLASRVQFAGSLCSIGECVSDNLSSIYVIVKM